MNTRLVLSALTARVWIERDVIKQHHFATFNVYDISCTSVPQPEPLENWVERNNIQITPPR